MGYSPAFWLKIGQFRTLVNSPEIDTNNPASSWKCTYKAPQGVRSDFQHLPKSAIFKIMGYSPDFLLKIDRFGHLGIHTESLRTSPKTVRNDFQHLPKSGCFKTTSGTPASIRPPHPHPPLNREGMSFGINPEEGKKKNVGKPFKLSAATEWNATDAAGSKNRDQSKVSGDGPTLPSLRPKVWVGAGLGIGLGLREGRVGSSTFVSDWLQGNFFRK